MLTAHRLSKRFDLEPLFENVTFSVNPGERVGLIGVNGSGKTTIMRILAGADAATSGHVSHANDLRIGYLTQGFELDGDSTVGNIIAGVIGNIDALESELGDLAIQLGERPDDNELIARYDEVLRLISSADNGQAATVLNALGLDTIDEDLPTRLLSGGQKTRLTLATVLLNDPQLLLLDEPTNHLDIGMLEWLEKWLADFAGGVLLISHDRTFLDRTVTRIIDLDKQQRTIRQYDGNYSDYLAEYNRARDAQWSKYRDQVYEERRLKQDAQRERERGMKIHRTTTAGMPYLRKKAKKAMSRAKSKEKRLERFENDEDRVEKPQQSWQLDVEFGDLGHLGKSVLTLEKLSVGYAKEAPLLTDLDLEIRGGQRIVLTGANGSGKTTLIRTIAGQLPVVDGAFRVSSSAKIGYMSQEQSLLDPDKSPLETIMQVGFGNQTDARTYLHKYLFKGDEALKPNALLSFGQRARLMLAMLVADGCNFLLLDEPINHLDIPSRTMFEQALTQFPGTTLAVIHDRYFIERFATEIWWVDNGGIHRELR